MRKAACDRWHIHDEMVASGWEMIGGQNDGKNTYYAMNITTVNDECRCVATVCTNPEENMSEWGVLWIYVRDVEIPVPDYAENGEHYLAYEDLENMQASIERAEWNLVSLGIPFYEDKSFHGPKSRLMQKKNLRNRIRWGWSEPEGKEKAAK